VITSLIKQIAWNLDENEVSYMIIGGQAVLLYGTPRLTRDIDITLGIDTDEFRRIEKVCSNIGLKPLADDPEAFAARTKVLPAEEPQSKFRVDFIFSFTSYETQAIRRAQEVFMDGYPVRFASCEDVIIHKMIAARAIDLEDVRHMLAKNGERLDYEYLRQWLAEFSAIPGCEQVEESFKRLLNE
jgi:predicted nucleotidyltransferase